MLYSMFCTVYLGGDRFLGESSELGDTCPVEMVD